MGRLTTAVPVTRMLRKSRQTLAWVRSVRGPADWPAAVLLAFFRTRPPIGTGRIDRLARRFCPQIWIRPRLLRGARLRIAPTHLSHFVIYEEMFIDRAYDLDLLAFAPDAIVDCGAFEGYFSLLARARFASAPIVAFEPNPKNFEGLITNVNANQVTLDARRAAVSTKEGEATFTGDGCGGRLTSREGADSVRVPVTDLRRVLTELAPQRLLLKLDIEGEELTLLPAILPVLPSQCAIFFEWHHGEAALQSMTALLGESGFAVHRGRTMVDAGVTFVDAFAQRSEVP